MGTHTHFQIYLSKISKLWSLPFLWVLTFWKSCRLTVSNSWNYKQFRHARCNCPYKNWITEPLRRPLLQVNANAFTRGLNKCTLLSIVLHVGDTHYNWFCLLMRWLSHIQLVQVVSLTCHCLYLWTVGTPICTTGKLRYYSSSKFSDFWAL